MKHRSTRRKRSRNSPAMVRCEMATLDRYLAKPMDCRIPACFRESRTAHLESTRACQSGNKASEENLIDEVSQFIERFVFFRQPVYYQLVALWTIATHLYKDFDYMGYIFACSPEPQSGKSRLLEVLDELVANSSGILISPSEAVLFRTASDHTQLLDEVDGWTNREELRGVLNAGFHAGARVVRMVEGRNDFKPVEHEVYAPRVLAGIGKTIFTAATLDRTFALEMVRQTRKERRKRFRLREVGSQIAGLKRAINAWVKDNRQAIISSYARSEFPYLDHFRDRTIDVSQPLAAILEAAFSNHSMLEHARESLVDAVALSRNDADLAPEEQEILYALIEVAQNEGKVVGNATELAAKCEDVIREKIYPNQVSSLLRRHGFENKSVRKEGKVLRRYELTSNQLTEITARYGKASGAVPSTRDVRLGALAASMEQSAGEGVVTVVGSEGERAEAEDRLDGADAFSPSEATTVTTPRLEDSRG
jgi:hypothetical protein